MSGAIIRRVTSPDTMPISGLGALLIDAVQGGASVGFLAGITDAEASAYWHQVAGAFDHYRLWVAEADGRVVGSVQIAPGTKANGRHRAEVQKLLVRRDCRGQGLARRLMEACETDARALGLRLLFLDTEAGSPAEAIYQHLGWEKSGEIPLYFARPSGELGTTAVYFKRLSPPDPRWT